MVAEFKRFNDRTESIGESIHNFVDPSNVKSVDNFLGFGKIINWDKQIINQFVADLTLLTQRLTSCDH